MDMSHNITIFLANPSIQDSKRLFLALLARCTICTRVLVKKKILYDCPCVVL